MVLKKFFIGIVAGLIAAESVFLVFVSVTPAGAQEAGLVPSEDYDIPYIADSLTDLDWALEREGNLELAPQDQKKIEDEKVDVRVTNFLIYLITPVEQGGAGLTHVKAKRIFKNYDTKGIGRFDRESLEAIEESTSLLSAHHDGKGVDISEIGAITCKAVEKRHLGGSTTRWQPPTPIKVAWQSRDGISRLPTPTGDSLIATSQAMTADSIVRYLNESGEMDAYVDVAKGMGLDGIAQYVGANVLLKTLGITQVKDDPLATDTISVIGAAILEKYLPNLPEGVVVAHDNEDVRIGIGKAQLEQALNLPPGSLRGRGWNDLLSNAGKRVLEEALGLPALELERRPLSELIKDEKVKAAFDFLLRKDDAFNFTPGTVEGLKKGDETALKKAGVNVVASAFKLDQKARQILEQAVINDRIPNLDPAGWPIDNQFPIDSLKNYLSGDERQQREALEQFKAVGTALLESAVGKTVPSAYDGMSQDILKLLTQSQKEVMLGEILRKLGAGRLLAETDQDLGSLQRFLTNPARSGLSGRVAAELNELLDLPDSGRLGGKDVEAMFSRGNFAVFKKVGAAQVDRAIGWNQGTGLEVINGQKKLDVAMGEVFAGSIANILGLEAQSFSLKGDLKEGYGAAVIETRLGLPVGSFRGGPDAGRLIERIGDEKFQAVFGFAAAKNTPEFWENPRLNDKWQTLDRRLGVEAGTTKKYLRGEAAGKSLSQQVGKQSLETLTADKIWNYFDLEERFRISPRELQAVFDALTKSETPFEQQQAALSTIYKLIGRTVDQKTGFALDGFLKYLTSPNDGEATKALLDQGVQLLAKSVGVKLGNLKVEDLEQIGKEIQQVFNNGTAGFERLRAEYSQLEQLGQARTAQQEARYQDLRRNVAIGTYVRLTDFFVRATGIPTEFRSDAEAFLRGDYRTGIAGMSFVLWQQNVNPYLPPGGQLTYEELRTSFVFDDAGLIEDRARANFLESGTETEVKYTSFENMPPELLESFRATARSQIMGEAKKQAEYKISDSFLRKADPTIPAGFSRVMFNGTDQEKAAVLELWAFNHLDAAIKTVDAAYQPGTLQALYKGSGSERQAIALRELARRSGIEMGPLNGEVMASYIDYLTSPLQDRHSFYTDPKYNAMWGAVDSWLGSNLKIGPLPEGLGRSLFVASQNGWNFDAEIKDATSKVIVPSLTSLGQNYLETQITSWADTQFNLPTGTVLRTYQAGQSVIAASKALALAHKTGDAAKVAAASKNLSQAQASLTVLAITTALNACAACQQFFGSVDQALSAPPGFTNAAVAGAVAMAFGLGPAGLYVAAAIYLFGVYKVEYLCPKPPREIYAISQFDKEFDRLEYGYDYDPATGPAKATPKPGTAFTFNGTSYGENPFDWDDTVEFADGNNPELWMGWARYFTGRLLEETAAYAEDRPIRDKPRQIMTLRQANIEFFGPRSAGVFGEFEKDNSRVGFGYTQDSTKTTDWVHVAFGGLF